MGSLWGMKHIPKHKCLQNYPNIISPVESPYINLASQTRLFGIGSKVELSSSK